MSPAFLTQKQIELTRLLKNLRGVRNDVAEPRPARRALTDIAVTTRAMALARETDLRHDGEFTKTDFLSKALDIFNDEVEPLMKEIEDLIQEKLFPALGS